MHILLAMRRNFRNWHQIFDKRSGSYKIHALPIFIFLVYQVHGKIDYLKKHMQPNFNLFFKNWYNLHIDQCRWRFVKRQLKRLGMVQKKKTVSNHLKCHYPTLRRTTSSNFWQSIYIKHQSPLTVDNLTFSKSSPMELLATITII